MAADELDGCVRRVDRVLAGRGNLAIVVGAKNAQRSFCHGGGLLVSAVTFMRCGNPATRIQAVVANGGTVDGVELLSPKTIDLIFDQQSDGVDVVLGIPLRFGIGYALPEPTTFPFIPDGRICFWGGAGGSVIVIDVEQRMTIAYIMNKMFPAIVGNPTAKAIVTTAYKVA